MIGKTKCNIKQQHCCGNGKMSVEAMDVTEIKLAICFSQRP